VGDRATAGWLVDVGPAVAGRASMTIGRFRIAFRFHWKTWYVLPSGMLTYDDTFCFDPDNEEGDWILGFGFLCVSVTMVWAGRYKS
jgi:hypothetical protein